MPSLVALRLSSAWRQAYVSAAAIGVLRRTERRIAHAGLTVLQVARRMAQKVLVLVDAHRLVIPTEARLQADSPLSAPWGFSASRSVCPPYAVSMNTWRGSGSRFFSRTTSA